MSARTSLVPRYAIFLFVALVVALAGSMSAWRFAADDELDRYREDRFRFSLSNVQSALESGLRLGFAASDLPGAQDLIDRVRARQPAILSIDVFDDDGRVLFTTDPAGLGATVPLAWRETCLSPGVGVQRIDDDGDRIQCLGLVNSFEQLSAGVLLRYRGSGGARPLQGWPGDPGLLLAGFAAIFLLAVFIGWIVIRPIEQRLGNALAGIESAGLPQDDPLIGHGAPALQKLSEMDAALARAEAEADRIDRMEAS
jgi:hypothetical protein